MKGQQRKKILYFWCESGSLSLKLYNTVLVLIHTLFRFYFYMKRSNVDVAYRTQ